jgi:hypothetical protein
MRMLSFPMPRHDRKRRVEKVLNTAQSVGDMVGPSTQRAHYDGVLVDPNALASRDTLQLIRQLRRENTYTSWFAFSRYPAALNGVIQLSRIEVRLSP